MARGGRRRDRDDPERRCVVLGESGPASGLLRFALSPDGIVVPDVAGKLPGRGAWLTPDRETLAKAVKRKAFARAFRTAVTLPDDLGGMIEGLLLRRLVDTLSLARKAGQAITGAEKVRARIQSGEAAVLLQASDGANDGVRRLENLARGVSGGEIAQIRLLTAQEMGLAFGREFAIHATLDAGGFADRAIADAARLAGFRPVADNPTSLAEGQADRLLQNDEVPAGGAGTKDDQ